MVVLEYGQCYSALASGCSRPVAAQAIARLLEDATDTGLPFYEDGTHVNGLGVDAVVPFVEEIGALYNADAIVSDSCLCGGAEDWHGCRVRKSLSRPVAPWWGAAFTTGKFADAIYNAWTAQREARTIVVLVAGNDLANKWVVASDISKGMVRNREYWADINVEIIFVDVVPEAWRVF